MFMAVRIRIPATRPFSDMVYTDSGPRSRRMHHYTDDLRTVLDHPSEGRGRGDFWQRKRSLGKIGPA